MPPSRTDPPRRSFANGDGLVVIESSDGVSEVNTVPGEIGDRLAAVPLDLHATVYVRSYILSTWRHFSLTQLQLEDDEIARPASGVNAPLAAAWSRCGFATYHALPPQIAAVVGVSKSGCRLSRISIRSIASGALRT
jgi:hypothetical protein